MQKAPKVLYMLHSPKHPALTEARGGFTWLRFYSEHKLIFTFAHHILHIKRGHVEDLIYTRITEQHKLKSQKGYLQFVLFHSVNVYFGSDVWPNSTQLSPRSVWWIFFSLHCERKMIVWTHKNKKLDYNPSHISIPLHISPIYIYVRDFYVSQLDIQENVDKQLHPIFAKMWPWYGRPNSCKYK